MNPEANWYTFFTSKWKINTIYNCGFSRKNQGTPCFVIKTMKMTSKIYMYICGDVNGEIRNKATRLHLAGHYY